MKRRHAVIVLCLILVLSIVAALFGLGLSYHRSFGPKDSLGELSMIGGDAWVQDGASISFYDLASRGNHLKLYMRGWRPTGQSEARYEVRVCDKVAAAFEDDGKTVQNVPLLGECEPRLVSFRVLNPINPGPNDRRRLGSQLKRLEVTSRLGVPILQPSIIIVVAAAIAILSLLGVFLLWTTGQGYISLLIPAISFLFLLNASFMEYYKLFPLWLLCVGVAIGVLTVPVVGAKIANKDQGIKKSHLRHAGIGSFLLLLAIVAAAAAFRFYHLDFGLPENYHPDEVPKVNAIMRMVQSGTLNPNYFLHPSLLLYSTYFMNAILHFFGISGEFRDTAFFAGRLVSCLTGIFSVALLYYIAKNLYSSGTGLIAATLLAFSPIHVTCSRYLKEDALLTFFILATTLSVVIAVQKDKKRYLLLAAILAGCSASVKYSGLLSIAILCAAPWLRSGNRRPDPMFLKTLYFALIMVPLAFVICSPYTVINAAKFVRDFSSEGNHMLRGHTNAVTAWSQYWMYHIKRSIFPGMGFIPTMLSFAGIGVLIWRRRREDLFVVFLLLLFYLPAEWVKAKPAPQPERYILPCIPMLSLAAGEFLRLFLCSKRKILASILTVVALGMPVWRVATLASDMKHDTRARSAEWIRNNIPKQSRLYLDWKRYCPDLSRDDFQSTYIPRADILRSLEMENLKKSNQDYLILSSLFYDRYFTDPESPAGPRNIFRNIFEKLPVIAEFTPRFGTYGFHNPVITVFSLKESDISVLQDELVKKRQGFIEKTSNEKKSSLYWKEKKHWILLDFQYLRPRY